MALAARQPDGVPRKRAWGSGSVVFVLARVGAERRLPRDLLSPHIDGVASDGS